MGQLVPFPKPRAPRRAPRVGHGLAGHLVEWHAEARILRPSEPDQHVSCLLEQHVPGSVRMRSAHVDGRPHSHPSDVGNPHADWGLLSAPLACLWLEVNTCGVPRPTVHLSHLHGRVTLAGIEGPVQLEAVLTVGSTGILGASWTAHALRVPGVVLHGRLHPPTGRG